MIVWLNSTATSSISFNTISIWSTWDDATNSEVPLGRLPQSGDYIYANGYTCLIPTGTLNLGTAILSNGDNPYTGRNGGSFFYSAAGTYNITANLEHYGYSTLLGTSTIGSANRQTTLQGNIISYTTNGICAVSAGGSNGAFTTINGNLNGAFCIQSAWGYSKVTVNGNINIDDGNPAILIYQSGGGTPTETIIVNGNAKNEFVQWIGTAGSANIYVYGTYTHDSAVSFNKSVSKFIFGTLINTGSVLTCTSVTIYSSLIYKGYNNYIGIMYQNLYTPNPDTFTCKDITEPRSNPFIILTDAEMNNRQQYPPENEVKEGTEYVWGEKVGTYQQPPESVVLKDYLYDTITAEENDVATYNLTRYIYADYGTLHWFELKTTTTDILTTPSQQSISIDGETVVADTDYVVEYDDACYQWSGSAWGSITAKNIGTVKTDIVTNPTETTLGVKKGTLETIPQVTLSRMQNTLTVDIFQQILDSHLNN